jgi:hypothetical protein
MRVRLLTLALLAAGCNGPPAARPADGGAAPPAPAANDCEAQRAAIRGLIAAAPRACATDADCGMYAGGPVDCGGVVDRASATRIQQLTDAFRAQQCRFAVHCGPRAAWPACQDGRCFESPTARPSVPGGRRP